MTGGNVFSYDPDLGAKIYEGTRLVFDSSRLQPVQTGYYTGTFTVPLAPKGLANGLALKTVRTLKTGLVAGTTHVQGQVKYAFKNGIVSNTVIYPLQGTNVIYASTVNMYPAAGSEVQYRANDAGPEALGVVMAVTGYVSGSSLLAECEIYCPSTAESLFDPSLFSGTVTATYHAFTYGFI